MKFRLAVEYDQQANRWSAVFPEVPGCGSAGDSEEEAIINAKEALALWFEPTPVELHKGARNGAIPMAGKTWSPSMAPNRSRSAP